MGAAALDLRRGAGQVLITAAVLGALLYLTHFAWQAAVIGGIGLAMSSTAMALQLMREKGMNRNEGGQLGFSVLLFQDMAVIPALALIPILAGAAAPATTGRRSRSRWRRSAAC